MDNICFKRIVIREKGSLASGKAGVAFAWKYEENKPINIFYYRNNAGKTTLYNIIYDVIDYKESKGEDLFTNDLFVRGIEVEIQFEIKGHIFTLTKNYISNDINIKVKNLIKNQEIELKTKIEYRTFIEKLLGIPQNIRYLDDEKITFFNLLHLHFVNDKEYKGNLKSKYHYCTIANHIFDGISTPLFYYYIFNIFKDNEDLAEAYNLGTNYRRLEKKVEEYEHLLKLTISDKPVDKGQGILFDSENELQKLDYVKNKITQAKVEVLNYKESLLIIEQILQRLQKAKSTLEGKSSQINAWRQVLTHNKSQIEEAIVRLQRYEIIEMQKQKREIEEKIQGLEGYEIEKIKDRYELAKKSLKTDGLTTLDFLKDLDLTKTKFEKARSQFIEAIKGLKINDSLDSFNRIMKGFLPEDVNAELSIEEGKVRVNTSSDSINRIVRFVALFSFLLLKNPDNQLNHFNFLFADSPFIGIDTKLLHEVLYKLFAAVKQNSVDSQFFIFLNKNNEDEYKGAFTDYSEIINLYTGEGKILNLT